ERFRELEIAVAPPALQQLERAGREERIVVEITREPRAAVLVGRAEPPVLPHLAADEIERLGRGFGERRLPEPARRACERADCEAVPRRDDLVVPPRPHALLARGEQLLPRAREGRIVERRVARAAFRRGRRRELELEVPGPPFEVRRAIEPESGLRGAGLVRLEQRRDLVLRPQVALAFLALRVRIERRVERALGVAHVAQQPSGGLRGDAGVERPTG